MNTNTEHADLAQNSYATLHRESFHEMFSMTPIARFTKDFFLGEEGVVWSEISPSQTHRLSDSGPISCGGVPAGEIVA